MAQASEPLRSLDTVAAIAQHCSPATSITGNALASSQFENIRAPDGVSSTNVVVNSSGAFESCHTAGNTGSRARTSAHHPRAKSHSARVLTQYGSAVQQRAAPPPTATPPSCLNCGATDHLVRACPINLGCSVVCYTCCGAGHISRVFPSRSNQLFTSENTAPTPIVLNASPGVEKPRGTKLNAPLRESYRPEFYLPPN